MSDVTTHPAHKKLEMFMCEPLIVPGRVVEGCALCVISEVAATYTVRVLCVADTLSRQEMSSFYVHSEVLKQAGGNA